MRVVLEDRKSGHSAHPNAPQAGCLGAGMMGGDGWGVGTAMPSFEAYIPCMGGPNRHTRHTRRLLREGKPSSSEAWRVGCVGWVAQFSLCTTAPRCFSPSSSPPIDVGIADSRSSPSRCWCFTATRSQGLASPARRGLLSAADAATGAQRESGERRHAWRDVLERCGCEAAACSGCGAPLTGAA